MRLTVVLRSVSLGRQSGSRLAGALTMSSVILGVPPQLGAGWQETRSPRRSTIEPKALTTTKAAILTPLISRNAAPWPEWARQPKKSPCIAMRPAPCAPSGKMPGRSRLREPLVRIDFVQPPAAKVVDDRPGRVRVVVPCAAADALVLEAGRNGGDGLLAVDPAAGEDDR